MVKDLLVAPLKCRALRVGPSVRLENGAERRAEVGCQPRTAPVRCSGEACGGRSVVRGSGSSEQKERKREAHRTRRAEDKVRGRLVKAGAWRLRGGHYDRRRGRSGLPRGGETSRPERKSAASRIVLDSRLLIPRD
jgi:hypothetical protein